MEDSTEEDESLGPLLGAFQGTSLNGLLTEHEGIARQFSFLDPVKASATFGSLLTVPNLQSNCLRIEALAHLALMTGNGHRILTKEVVGRTFGAMGIGICGRHEDPAEDMFVTSISTHRGNFRILEGIWESAGFYLQRIVNVVESMPHREDFEFLRESVYALLGLSEILCHRMRLPRNSLGNPIPLKRFPEKIISALPELRKVNRLSKSEISHANISLAHLSAFAFNPEERGQLHHEAIGHSLLERKPLAFHEDSVFLILPTAVSAAIRRYVMETIEFSKNREAFLDALGSEYTHLFARTPLLGEEFGVRIKFQRSKIGALASTSAQIDRGRFLNLVFYLDNLDGFTESGLTGFNTDPHNLIDEFDKSIDHSFQNATKSSQYENGLTLLVSCGIGRGSQNYLTRKDRKNWRQEFVSAADFFAISWMPEFSTLAFWRMLDAREKIRSLGVALFNVNGLANLVAWTESLEGSLVPHGRLPDGFVRDEATSFVMIEQNALRTLRHEVAIHWDSHVERNTVGKFVRVRKIGDSRFKDDRSFALYAVDERFVGTSPPIVFVTKKRLWWCQVSVPSTTPPQQAYERAKMLTVWLPRMASVADDTLLTLPSSPILLRIEFHVVGGTIEEEPTEISLSLLRSEIAIHPNSDKGECTISLGPLFENAQFNSENIAEKTLVSAMLDGANQLSSNPLSASALETLLEKIVPNTRARYGHVFRAREFRDFTQSALPRSVVTIDKVDSSFMKLGLAFKVRERGAAPYIEGKQDCVEFLNKLVSVLEDELCSDLKRFDRAQMISYVLKNHEAAAVDRDRWRRTSAAVLALHSDRKETLGVISQRNFEINAVFLSTRLLVEFALCECPTHGEITLGRFDLSHFMAKAAQIFALGGWSDAIRWDLMEPNLRITPLGDVHANLDFVSNVIDPFAHDSNEVFIDDAVKNYAKNMEKMVVQKKVDESFESEFLDAWIEEAGASLNDFKVFVDYLEDLGAERNEAILTVGRDELLDIKVDDESLDARTSSAIIEFLTLKPRAHWRDVPEGFDARDLHPWRFRRRLSVLRKPLLQVNCGENPTLIVAPGLLRDSFVALVGNYHRGEFPARHLRAKMLRWSGHAARLQGSAFSHAVSDRLRELGWHTEVEIRITKLLKTGFTKDYGDVDVFAWNPNSQRILAIECKDLQFRKTYGEIAEQLRDFRGDFGADGKPDDLLRHFQRIDLIRNNARALSDWTGFSATQIESHLVFRNPVPMQFALKRLSEQVSVSVFSQLENL